MGKMIPWPQVPREEATESWLVDFMSDPETFGSLGHPETSPMDCGDLLLPSCLG